MQVEVRELAATHEWEQVRQMWGQPQIEAEDTLLIAWAGSRPVGRLEVRWRGSKHEHVARRIGRVPELCRMWVAEQFRGHGIAGELIGSAKALASRRGDRHVGLAVGVENHSALHAYEKADFSRLGIQRFDSPHGPDGTHTVVYLTSTTDTSVSSARATA